MNNLILYSFRRCPFAMRARMTFLIMKIKYEIREIHLKEKPDEMIKLSSKGTVPVLFDPMRNIVIDESLEIMKVFLAKSKNKNFQFNTNNLEFTKNFDNVFKHHLDRYKYSHRYDVDPQNHRDYCDDILGELDKSISDSKWIFSDEVSLLDISILPFIRQFKIADDEYFFNQKYLKVIKLLNQFEDSSLFRQIMNKYDVWSASDNNSVLFPTAL